ncbi:hypothetical protein N7G274_003247 [Stereocaulon virgatum]|uniref:Carboxypeptidase n=1 Tax=Stereocaulon virgatum TaxID=373712 RepID=A0ABR4AF83_9LECA
MQLLLAFTAAVSLLRYASAQFPPTPNGVTTLKSKFNSDITISYKEPGICETTPGVKSYSGYVHLPPGTLSDLGVYQNYSINTFFWFFESRKDPANAPLSIWLNGGPGSSSMIGLLQENGPCVINDDSNSTTLNPWSWNNEVNMLYIDQPVQTGFSWDILTNVTLDLTNTDGPTPADFTNGVPQQNNTFMVGTLPSQEPANTVNTTQNAARALWHFAQTWFQEFPDYKPNNDAISIFTESYGGRYGPAYAAFFEEQNQRIANGSFKENGNAYIIHLDTLGIINGCVDYLTQALSYLDMAYNNTYGIQAINKYQHDSGVTYFRQPGGCREQIVKCRAAADAGDPNMTGNNSTVNDACNTAYLDCYDNIDYQYTSSGRDVYDIAANATDPFPPNYYFGYLSQAYVQAALGVPVNWTQSNSAVFTAFSERTADYVRTDIRGGFLDDLAYVLESGIKVALIYGDRDYICNWIGGEEVSLAVDYNQKDAFHSAGYTNITTNSSYVGGLVRQHGNFSFSRVFQAGHEVPAYQPETAYRIFSRAIFGQDIATGTVATTNNSDYSTTGPSDTFSIKNQDLGPPNPQCYILALNTTCTDDQYLRVLNGSALIHDYILIDANQSHLFPGVGNNDKPTASSTSGAPRQTSSSANPASSTGGAVRLGGDWTVLGMMWLAVGAAAAAL